MFTVQIQNESVYVMPMDSNRMSMLSRLAKLAQLEPGKEITLRMGGIIRLVVKDDEVLHRASGVDLPQLLAPGDNSSKAQVEAQQLKTMFWGMNPSMCGQLLNQRLNLTPSAAALDADWERKITKNDAAEYKEAYARHVEEVA